jgi:hypothetical protein
VETARAIVASNAVDRDARRCSTHAYTVGNTNNVKIVDDTNPPITTVASGRCTSAPALRDTAIGMNPTLATNAVMSTGRNRTSAPSRTASPSARPAPRS